MNLIHKMIVMALAALALPTIAHAQANALQKDYGQEYIDAIAASTRYVSKRPKEEERLFRSEAIEKEIKRVKKLLKDTPTPLTRLFTLPPMKTESLILSCTQAIFLPCGFATRGHRCGLMCSLQTRIRL